MKQVYGKILAAFLAATLLCGTTVPALASEALGEDLTQQEILLHEETMLSTNVFWSATYSDLRTEHYVMYEPNDEVTPIVTSGTVLREQNTVTAAAGKL